MRSDKRVGATRPDQAGNPTNRPDHRPARRFRLGDWAVYPAIAAGGAVGGLARWAVGVALPTRAGAIPWATLLTNVTGCFLLGALTVWLHGRPAPERFARAPRRRTAPTSAAGRPPNRYLGPMLTVGVLGGYTTFSAFALETHDLLAAGHPARAFSYATGSLTAGVLAVLCGMALTRVLLSRPAGRPTRTASAPAANPVSGPGGQTDGIGS